MAIRASTGRHDGALRRDSVHRGRSAASAEGGSPRTLIDSEHAACGLRLLRDLGGYTASFRSWKGIGAAHDPPTSTRLRAQPAVVETSPTSPNPRRVPGVYGSLWRELDHADRACSSWQGCDMGKPGAASTPPGAEYAAVSFRLGLEADDVDMARLISSIWRWRGGPGPSIWTRTSRSATRGTGGRARTLNLLYLLTYADTKAVGSGCSGDISGGSGRLYARALAVLAGGHGGHRPRRPRSGGARRR